MPLRHVYEDGPSQADPGQRRVAPVAGIGLHDSGDDAGDIDLPRAAPGPEDSVVREVTDADRAIGQRIRKARLDRKVTARSLSSQLNITIQQMQKYENGINRISASRLLIISVFLDVPVAELFGLTETASDAIAFSSQTRTFASAFERLPDGSVKQQLYALVTALADDQP